MKFEVTLPTYQAGIEAYCQRVIEAFQPDCIIVHGSIARGTHHPYSDVDILIIGGKLSPDFFTRLFHLNRLRDGKTPIEAVAYSRDEWEQMRRQFHLTALEAMEYGIPLHGETLFAAWKLEFERWKMMGLRRRDAGWSTPAAPCDGTPLHHRSELPTMMP